MFLLDAYRFANKLYFFVFLPFLKPNWEATLAMPRLLQFILVYCVQFWVPQYKTQNNGMSPEKYHEVV